MKNRIHSLWYRWVLPCWEYLGEILLAGLLCFLIFRLAGQNVLFKRVSDLRSDLIICFGVAIGISAAVWGIFLTILTTEFGGWLRKKREAEHYSRALAFPIFANLAALLALLLMIPAKSVNTLRLVIFIFLYALINFVTMIRNVNGIVRLWQDYQICGERGPESNR